MVGCVLFCLMLMSPGDDAPADEDLSASLAKVRRVYVDILTGGDSALQLRDLLIASLDKSKIFVITEDEDKADAVLKGAGSDEVFTDVHNSSDSLNAHSQVGGGATGTSRTTGSKYASVGFGENETRHTEERRHEALAAVRLVNNDGDVIWSATAESLGGKFLGASADVADKIAKRLAADIRAARGQAKKQDGR